MRVTVRLPAALLAASTAAGCGSAAAVHHSPTARQSPAAARPAHAPRTSILTGVCGKFWADTSAAPVTRTAMRTLGHQLARLTSAAASQNGVPLTLPNDVGDAGLALVKASYAPPGSSFRQQVFHSGLRAVVADCTY